jgi:autophagy-related protein 5
MGQLKEADFVRWGNTKRMTGLRKQDQDGIWEGIKERKLAVSLLYMRDSVCSSFLDNFDDYWRVASKIVPTTAPARSNSPPPSTNPSMHTRPPPAEPQSAPDRDNAYNVRSVPVRLYLPDGPVMQDVVPPTLEDGVFLSRGLLVKDCWN